MNFDMKIKNVKKLSIKEQHQNTRIQWHMITNKKKKHKNLNYARFIETFQFASLSQIHIYWLIHVFLNIINIHQFKNSIVL